jgi:uncharacterized membrane protein YhhN
VRAAARAGRALPAAALVAALVYFVGMAADVSWLRLVSKPLPSLLLAAWVTLRCRDRLGRLVAVGLVVSAFADTLLEIGRFLPGLAGFLLAHSCYVAAFVSADARPAIGRALPFAAFGVVAFGRLRPGLGGVSMPVAVYVAAICAMMWRAAARVGGRTPAHAAWIGLAGALAFGASDTILAVNRFSGPVPGAGWPIMILYWLGQAGIAASAALACRPREGMLPGR